MLTAWSAFPMLDRLFDDVMNDVTGGFARDKGALIGDVAPASAGEKAGLKLGDVILSVDGTEIAHSHEVPRLIARHAPGSHVKLEVWRDKHRRTFDVTLDELKDNAENAKADARKPDKESSDVPSARSFNEPGTVVVVRRMHPDSPADGVRSCCASSATESRATSRSTAHERCKEG